VNKLISLLILNKLDDVKFKILLKKIQIVMQSHRDAKSYINCVKHQLVNETLGSENETLDFQSKTRPRNDYEHSHDHCDHSPDQCDHMMMITRPSHFFRGWDVWKISLEAVLRPRLHPCIWLVTINVITNDNDHDHCDHRYDYSDDQSDHRYDYDHSPDQSD